MHPASFSQDSKDVRAASIALFGDLSRFGVGASEMPYLEQIHTNFVSILLHLDEETDVTKVILQCLSLFYMIHCHEECYHSPISAQCSAEYFSLFLHSLELCLH